MLLLLVAPASSSSSSTALVWVSVVLLQARPPAAAFIGYGGVVKRAPVEAGADWFVTCFSDVLKVLA